MVARAILDCICQILYGIVLVINLLWATALAKLFSLCPLSKSTREGLAIWACQGAFRAICLLTPWVWITTDDRSREEIAKMEAEMAERDAQAAADKSLYPSVFILSNHTSFFDTILCTAKIPCRMMWRIRLYFGSHLLKMPILGTLNTTGGQFPVHFTSSEDGKFKLDPEKEAETEKLVEAHIGGGGWMGIFPEGQINKNPDEFLPFRFGGMKKALKWDARILALVHHNCSRVWPRGAPVGGRPCHVRYTFRCLAPDGVRAYVAEVRARPGLSSEDAAMQDHELLAKYLRQDMQQEYDEMREASCGKAKALKQPLLP